MTTVSREENAAPSFWKSPFNEGRFNEDYCRAMLMALVIHVFQKDWGLMGGISVLSICAAWAMFQAYSRALSTKAKP